MKFIGINHAITISLLLVLIIAVPPCSAFGSVSVKSDKLASFYQPSITCRYPALKKATTSTVSGINVDSQLNLSIKNDENSASDGMKTSPMAGFVGGLGVAANMVVAYSLYVIKTTGCNIVPKFSIEGFLLEQGACVAAVLGIFSWSIWTKAKTGSGLPPGPAGMLGAAEGLSFLTVLAGVVVLALNFSEFGGLFSTACNSSPSEYTQPLSFMK
jgi:hypothetical protein